MFSSKTAVFDRLLDKATSKLLLDPDWDSTLQICDNIRQGDVQPSYAIGAIRKKIENENPHVSKYALHVLESVVKNCGSIVHIEMATRDFMDFLKDQARKRQDPVKGKIVELVQVWSHAFRNEPSYKVVQEAYNEMKREGFTFPALKESDAMFLAEKAPEWRDGELCHRCRAAFTTFNRKHHCRACGQVFCQKCSSKTSIIPKYGIEKEVRVCDMCFDQISKPVSSAEKKDELPAEYISSALSKQPQVPPSRSEAEIQEEEELQLALALSQSEAEAKEKQKSKTSYGYTAPSAAASSSINKPIESLYSQPVKQQQQQQVQQPHQPPQHQMMDTSDMDPELARYLNRNYWQQKSFEMKNTSVINNVTTQPSAPVVSSTNKKMDESQQNGLSETMNNEEQKGDNDEEREQFLKALGSSIEIFVNRMKSNSQRGRSIANDSSVQTLFMTLNAMHPTLLKYISQQEDNRAHYESLQDKLSQLKDARDALDVLREEHREKTRRKQEEMERLRQIQLAQKLEVLRQKKQVYLEYQRQMALQRMHEQEMEMRKRLEMQKQEQQMKAMQYGFPQGYAPQSMPPQSLVYQQQVPGQAPYAVNQMQAPPTQQPYVGNVYATAGGVHPQQQLQQQPNVAGYQQQMPMHEYPVVTTLPQQQQIVPPIMGGGTGIPQQQPPQQFSQQSQQGMNVANQPLPSFQQQQQPNVAGYPPQHVGINPQQQQQLNYQQQQTGMMQQPPPQPPPQQMGYPVNYPQATNVLPPEQQQQQQPGIYYSNGASQQPTPQHVHRPGPNEAELINFD